MKKQFPLFVSAVVAVAVVSLVPAGKVTAQDISPEMANQQTTHQPPMPRPPQGPRAWQWLEEQSSKIHTPPGVNPGEPWEWDETDFEEWRDEVQAVLSTLENPPAYVVRAMKTKRGKPTRIARQIRSLKREAVRKLREFERELARHQQEGVEEERRSQYEETQDKLNRLRENTYQGTQWGPYDTLQTLQEKRQKLEQAITELQQLQNKVPPGSQIYQEITNEIDNIHKHQLKYIIENIERMSQQMSGQSFDQNQPPPPPMETQIQPQPQSQPQPLQGNLSRIVNSNSPLRAFLYFLKILNISLF